jgi:hypothetical protein
LEFIAIFEAYIDFEDKNGRNLATRSSAGQKLAENLGDKKAKNRRFWIGRLGGYAGGLVKVATLDAHALRQCASSQAQINLSPYRCQLKHTQAQV